MIFCGSSSRSALASLNSRETKNSAMDYELEDKTEKDDKNKIISQ